MLKQSDEQCRKTGIGLRQEKMEKKNETNYCLIFRRSNIENLKSYNKS